MNRLFETFLKNFFQAEQTEYAVKSEKMAWQLEGNNAYLPGMLTDVSMTHKHEQKKVVLDAKFYKNMFQNQYGKDTFHSHNLYQMLAYLMHQPEELQLRGILIYPYNGRHIEESYKWNERISFEIKSIDLNAPWQTIRENLLSMIA